MEEDPQAPTAAEPSTASSPPDVMNDPAFDPDTKTRDKASDEADTCRICRGEGTPEEPLFYPCKCSGSIKFVHQECLMEWLSHSQKKYCELCKTPFRFTKLYHPQMPSRLPTSVFVRQALYHVAKLLMTWCRGLLVVSVWLILLPWSMRIVWRSLFWVGDGGWTRELYAEQAGRNSQTVQTQPLDLSTIRSAIDAAQSNVSVSLALPNFLMPFSQTLNMSAGEPTAWTLVKRFFFGIPTPYSDYSHLSGVNRTISNSTEVAVSSSRHPSLLSNVSCLQWFASPAANRFVIDVLEGLLITLLVVITFILIFLIREWVVQQQPVINMAAMNVNNPAADQVAQAAEVGFADDDPEDNENHPQAAPDVENEDTDHEGEDSDSPTVDTVEERPLFPPRHSSFVRSTDRALRRAIENSEEFPEELRRILQQGNASDIAAVIENMSQDDQRKVKDKLVELYENMRSARRASQGSLADPEAVPSQNIEQQFMVNPFTERTAEAENTAESSSVQSTAPRSDSVSQDPQQDTVASSHRPSMPARDRSFIATEIRRSLEEHNNWTLRSTVDASTESSGMPNQEVTADKEGVPDAWDDEDSGESGQGSDHSSESWQQIPDAAENDSDVIVEPESSVSKGKAKAIDIEQLAHSATSDSPADPPSRGRHGGDKDSVSAMYSPPSTGQPPTTSGPENPEEQQDGQPATTEPTQLREIAPQRGTLLERVVDWLWGDVAPAAPRALDDDTNDEQVVQNMADEAPFVPFLGNAPQPGNQPVQDAEVAAAAAQAGIDVNDQDAIDDAEDLEGILELIGMQGPITGLFQNAMFSAVLISATLACAVWFPYLWGKVVLLFMGSPVALFVKMPLQIIASFADLVVDTALCLGAGMVYWGVETLRWLFFPFTLGLFSKGVDTLADSVAAPARSVAENAMDRIGKLFLESTALSSPNYFRLSINSHAALRTIQNTTSGALNYTGDTVASWYEAVANLNSTEAPLAALRQVPLTGYAIAINALERIQHVASFLWKSKSYKITLDLGQTVPSTYTSFDSWSPSDRFIAILAGYAFFAAAGAFYLKRIAPITTSQQGRKVEGIVSDILQQAGGVFKVILIISIEMLAFPLYCGILLDVALLPLFENATLYSRYLYTLNHPWISGFVHWFVGTCYMFHFALFVSMCRKIMRRGVLYFIRDPDDPTFHPVRDVLERSVTTQLRKIAFSGLVYGGLVIVCLGGVVWSLGKSCDSVLPINWSSQSPSLEFPLDLLFYNFLTPLVIKIYKPSDGLHQMYQWWFKSSARLLRLSNFLFGEKNKEEEGHHVRRTWVSWFAGEKGDPSKPVIGEDRKQLQDDRGTEVYFLRDGKYVRAPASDQVRIPKGDTVFVEVDEDNHRKDGKPETTGVHARNSDTTAVVYIPPWFRVRIALFVLTIWFFAAATGVGMTVIPLLFGRHLFRRFLPPTARMSDIHAFSLGIYTLGGVIYSFLFLRPRISGLIQRISADPISTLRTAAQKTFTFSLHILRVSYVYTSLILLIPILFALLLELYILIPLHAYIGPHEPHVVHLIQDWTLGFLYARLAARLLFTDRASRPARAFNAVIANGYLNPNARLATRCFILPVSVLFACAVLFPSIAAWTLNHTLWYNADVATRSMVWRFSYPVVALAVGGAWAGREGVRMLGRWRGVVRDEVYLIGERLHNFGEKRPAPGQVVRRIGERS